MTPAQVFRAFELAAVGLALDLAPPRVRRFWRELADEAAAHATAVWVASLIGCLVLLARNPAAGRVCLEKFIAELIGFLTPPARRAAFALIAYLLGGTPMACANTHSSKVQGAGLCCAQVGVGLTPPPPGTLLPAYQAGQADAGAIPAGRIVQVTDSGGHCASCMIVGSTSRKHPGKPVLKFLRGGPSCPTAGTGCCSL